MNVLTGATGSTGRYVNSGFVPLKTRLERPKSEMLAEMQVLGSIDKFLHLAALVPTMECEANPSLAHEVNVEGAKRWFQAAAEVGCRHFVFASSSHVYGKVEAGSYLTPDQPTNPINRYGQLKLEAENELRRLSKSYPRTKLTIARIFSVLSDAMRPGFMLTGLHARAERKDFSPIPGLYATRDFMDAREVARDLVRVAEWIDAPEIVHICSGQPRRVEEVVRQVFSAHGVASGDLIAAPARPDDIPWLVGLPSLPPLSVP